jgi:DNA-binding transcriptional MerR regulator
MAVVAFRQAAGKSPNAFRTISEVATLLEVPQHVLRFWESRFAQIKPVKRAGGRRFYRPEDVDLLRGIRALLYVDGLTIRGAQKILKERGARHVAMIGRGKAPAPFAAPVEKLVEKKPAEKKPAERKPATRNKASHLRAVPSTPSFFDMLDKEPVKLDAQVGRHMAAEERAKLEALLAELEGLKAGLDRADQHPAA